jgi:hypothetical protein
MISPSIPLCGFHIGGRGGKYEHAQYALTEVCSCLIYIIIVRSPAFTLQVSGLIFSERIVANILSHPASDGFPGLPLIGYVFNSLHTNFVCGVTLINLAK